MVIADLGLEASSKSTQLDINSFVGSTLFHHSADNVDDLMRRVFARLLSGHKRNYKVVASKGPNTEVFGALLELTNPRARLGRSKSRARVFSPLGELLWYLSGSDALQPIQYYLKKYDEFSDDEATLNGAYGKRLFGSGRSVGQSEQDEWQRVIDTLRETADSRNAIIQIYSNADGRKRQPGNKRSKDIPCTCTLHFVIRRKKLHLHVHMRSNDAHWGMPHDIFSFTMLQEIAARELGVEVGSYQHSVASLHLYDDKDDEKARFRPRTDAQDFLNEGLFDEVPMPAMPSGDPWPAIREVLHAEAEIRAGNVGYEPPSALDPYWYDFIILLRAYALTERHNGQGMDQLLNQLTHDVYRLYILDLLAKRMPPDPPVVSSLFELDKVNAQGNP